MICTFMNILTIIKLLVSKINKGFFICQPRDSSGRFLDCSLNRFFEKSLSIFSEDNCISKKVNDLSLASDKEFLCIMKDTSIQESSIGTRLGHFSYRTFYSWDLANVILGTAYLLLLLLLLLLASEIDWDRFLNLTFSPWLGANHQS